MKLWRPNEAPVGGWYYFIEETNRRVPLKGTATGLESLIDQTVDVMTGLNMEVPDYIGELVEDQICQRQPPKRCRYTKGVGDFLSAAISGAAGMVDAIAGTQLQKKARSCGRCGKRRVKMNNLTSR